MRGIPNASTCKLSAGFTNEPRKFQRQLTRREGGAKFIDIADLPQALSVRRKEQEAEERARKHQEREEQRKRAQIEKVAKVSNCVFQLFEIKIYEFIIANFDKILIARCLLNVVSLVELFLSFKFSGYETSCNSRTEGQRICCCGRNSG